MSTKGLSDILLKEIDHVYHMALHLTRNATLAEDMVQDTYVKALEAMPSLKHPEKSRAWLFSILRNCFFNHVKRERKLHLIEEDAEFVSVDSLANASSFNDIESSWILEEALSQISDEFRMAVLLCDAEGLSYAEAAEAMDCPLGTVRSRLARGRSLLAVKLSQSMKKNRTKASLYESS